MYESYLFTPSCNKLRGLTPFYLLRHMVHAAFPPAIPPPATLSYEVELNVINPQHFTACLNLILGAISFPLSLSTGNSRKKYLPLIENFQEDLHVLGSPSSSSTLPRHIPTAAATWPATSARQSGRRTKNHVCHHHYLQGIAHSEVGRSEGAGADQNVSTSS